MQRSWKEDFGPGSILKLGIQIIVIVGSVMFFAAKQEARITSLERNDIQITKILDKITIIVDSRGPELDILKEKVSALQQAIKEDRETVEKKLNKIEDRINELSQRRGTGK